MKELVNRPDSQLEIDEQNNRLILTISTADSDQFKAIIEKAAKAVKKYQVKDCLIDLENRAGATQDTKQFALFHFQKVMDQGLGRMAIVLPEEVQSRQIASEFILEMGRDNLHTFTNREAAFDWLDGEAGQQKRAA